MKGYGIAILTVLIELAIMIGGGMYLEIWWLFPVGLFVMMLSLVFTPTRGEGRKISRQSESESYAKEKRKIQLESAGKFERAGRYEDAAKLYETLGMWDKAGECRRIAKE